MLTYKILEKEQFTVMGIQRSFTPETAYTEIPKFWDTVLHSGGNDEFCAVYGICFDGYEQYFDYLIAENYQPWKAVPEGFVTRVIPKGTWAVFPCRGALPNALQEVNTKIWNEWLPNCKEFKIAGNYTVEMYAPPAENPADYYCEIWVPVERI